MNRIMHIYGLTPFHLWGVDGTNVPPGPSNVVEVGVGAPFLALTSTNTVVTWVESVPDTSSLNLTATTNVPMGLSNVLSVGGGTLDSFALCLGHVALQKPQILSTSPSAAVPVWVTTATTLSVSATDTNLMQYPLTYQWFFDGTTIGLAATNYYSIPTGAAAVPLLADEGSYTVFITNFAGPGCVTWRLRMALPGMIAAWGSDMFYECDRPPLTNFIAVAAGQYHSVGLKEDGTVTNWGEFWDGSQFYPLVGPTNNRGFTAVAAGAQHDIGLLTNGTVAAWGQGTNAAANWVPNGLSNVTAIACGWDHNLALLSNGAVVAWGANLPYTTNLTSVPADLTNAGAATAISAAALHSLVLRSNGTVEAWGYGSYGETSAPTNLSNIVAVAAGGQHNLVLSNNGTVYAWGDNTSGQCNVPSALTDGSSNVMAIAAGWAHSVALLNNGTVVSWGDNYYGQTTVPSELTNAVGKSIAAGGNHTLELMFSPSLQYVVNVTNDLLLIYNSNSLDSSNVCFYYLSNRPMVSTVVSSANVLSLNCTNSETFLPADYTNQFATQISNWLANNPTKRPQYVILFQDIPSRVNIDGANPWPGTNSSPYPDTNYYWGTVADETPSVQYRLSTFCAGWNPIVTSINMNGYGRTNDCIAYINKLVQFGSNCSPGQLFISASAGGYGAENWYLYGGGGSNGVVAALPSANVITNFVIAQNVATNFTNVTGFYFNGIYYYNGFPATYAINGDIIFSNASSWYLILTGESYNGDRIGAGFEGNFIYWYSTNAFGGTNFTHYENTPVGAVTQTDEPYGQGTGNLPTSGNNPDIYFGCWAAGKPFGICAWNSALETVFQAVGDPFVKR